MNRPYILLTVMVVMVGAPFSFAAQEAVAKALTGTGGHDRLIGTDRDDRLEGRAGDDRIYARDGDDTIRGGRGEDRVYARDGDDTIEGGPGSDEIFPGQGDDEVYAGDGNDLIYARDTGGIDFINCGPGFDQVETIHRDDRTLSNCERALGPGRGDI
jgi:Ca2+-binding RTX toxin-like protein